MARLIHRSTDGTLDALVSSAVAAGTPVSVAEEARSITAARFAPMRERHQSDSSRVESYFWGVVRKRALTGQAPAIARLLVAASLASELREAGHAPGAVARVLI
jgi:hypothetical protein